MGRIAIYKKVVTDSHFEKVTFKQRSFWCVLRRSAFPAKRKKKMGEALWWGHIWQVLGIVSRLVWPDPSGEGDEFKGDMEGRSCRVCKQWETLWILFYRWWEATGDFELGVAWLDLLFRRSVTLGVVLRL